MRWIIYGAGAVGGTIGARLHLAGESVVLVARGEHARVLADSGMRFIHPGGTPDPKGVAAANDSTSSAAAATVNEVTEQLRIDVVEHPSQLAQSTQLEATPNDVILLCMKTQHTAAALADLMASSLHDLPIFCVQNGVANERIVSRVGANVYATVVNLPALHLEPGVIATYAGVAGEPGGVLDSGRYPGRVDAVSEAVCAGLRAAGFAAQARADVMAQKYAKLLSNLANALELLLRERSDFRDAGRVLRTEAEACYAAARIDYMPMRDYVRRNAGIYQPVDLPSVPRGGGSTWQSLQRGASEVETDYLNGEICLLGRLHGVATPANAQVQKLTREVIAGRRAANSFTWAEIDADKSQ